jgi:hypothetical protein
VVADLLANMAEQSLPRTETGSLLGDLRANARLVQRGLVLLSAATFWIVRAIGLIGGTSVVTAPGNGDATESPT